MDIILASTSPYRREQLERLTKKFKTHAPNVDEDSYKDKIRNPTELAETLAKLKAQSVLKDHLNDFIIGGDQVLSIDGEILGKPKTVEKAISQLGILSGKTHELITSTCYLSESYCEVKTVIARMKMRELTNSQIENYITAESPLNCCGSYMLENQGIALFEEIHCSDYTAIIGLPLMSTASILMKNGFSIF
ncbi:nucleoside triphosphate pyrophosphatase [Halobacteriovorax sp. JY17]|uniref:Maf family protein n=1 Tax=Halobacteriovorax sp. JY17 TaxID=2014617 RepID=UPI000C44C9F4|nr:nucleoside triphosphate pyrophosphatase [Halobacteriovorax sp. JY17]PIK15674.1 MAG: septum formation protein Maf [Halobacteriovorax sp. JY17]